MPSRDKYLLQTEFRLDFNESTNLILSRDKKNMAHSMFLIILCFEKKEKILSGPLENLMPHPVCPSPANFYNWFRSGGRFVQIKNVSLLQDEKLGGQCLVSMVRSSEKSKLQAAVIRGNTTKLMRVTQLHREFPTIRVILPTLLQQSGLVCSPAKSNISRYPEIYSLCSKLRSTQPAAMAGNDVWATKRHRVSITLCTWLVLLPKGLSACL